MALFGVCVLGGGCDDCQDGFVLEGYMCFQVGDVSSTWIVIVPDACVTSDLISRPASFLHPLPTPGLSVAGSLSCPLSWPGF